MLGPGNKTRLLDQVLIGAQSYVFHRLSVHYFRGMIFRKSNTEPNQRLLAPEVVTPLAETKA
jgi:hypothetical protein